MYLLPICKLNTAKLVTFVKFVGFTHRQFVETNSKADDINITNYPNKKQKKHPKVLEKLSLTQLNIYMH